MRHAIAAASFVLVCAAACGDSGGAGGGGAASTSTTVASSSATGNPNMCIQPGDPGNNNGVGHYCTPGGHECQAYPLAPLCLADVGQDEWFCTRIGCDAMTDCGMGAGCLLEGAGSACVPCKCDSGGVGCTPATSSSSSSSASSTSASSSSSGGG